MIVACMLFVGAIAQTVTGFGFAIVCVPLLTLMLEPGETVSTIVATGILVDISIMVASGRVPQPRWRDVGVLALWSVPGLALGGIGLKYLPDKVIETLMSLAVLLIVVRRLRAIRGGTDVDDHSTDARWWMPASAGILPGALSTATTLGGPPVVLYLTWKYRSSRLIRDTLVALSLVRLPLSIVVLLVSDTWVTPHSLPLLWVGAALGFAAGRVIFSRLTWTGYERASLVLLVVAAVGAIGSAFAP